MQLIPAPSFLLSNQGNARFHGRQNAPFRLRSPDLHGSAACFDDKKGVIDLSLRVLPDAP